MPALRRWRYWRCRSTTSGGGGTSRGGEDLSLSDAREQLAIAREYDEWAAYVRRGEIWERSRNHRAWVLGAWMLDRVVADEGFLGLVRASLARAEAPARDIAMFSVAVMDAAYPDRAGRGR